MSVVAVLTILAGCGGPATGSHSGSAATRCPTVVVPAYFTPHSQGAWNTIASGHSDVAWVIMNPDTGPGPSVQPGYRRILRRLRRAGERVLGYVPTRQGHRSTASLLAEVDHYRTWYGVRDIFFDEAPTGTSSEPLYRRLVAAVHARHGFAALNPGTVPAVGYFTFADAVVTFESTAARYERTSRRPRRLAGVPDRKIWNIVVQAPRQALRPVIEVATDRRAGVLYVTDGGPPNSYDHLPSYWSSEVRALRSGCRG
ncbi:MAG: spherulation-specific family 4 protein [Acidimicrobiales bacterium]